MPRVDPITDREALNAEGREAYDAVVERRGGRVAGPSA